MKRKFYIAGVIFISLLAVSCTNDDFESSEFGNSNTKVTKKILKSELKSELNGTIIDSTSVSNTEESSTDADGEPSNPKPPRK